jgi:O-antigen/teichoic acid export membrane protein
VVGVRLLTGVLTPSLYGQLALAMTFFTLFQQILLAPIGGAFSRFFILAQEKEQLTAFFQSVFWLAGRYSMLLLGLGVLIVAILVAAGQVDLAVMAIATALYTFVTGINIFADNIQNAARHRIVVAWHQGIAQWLRFLGAVFLVMVLSPSSQIAMFGYGISAAVVLTSQIYFLRHSVLKDRSPWHNFARHLPDEWVKKILAYAYPSIFWGLFTWAQLTSDRWALQIFTTTQDVGFYSALYQLGYYPVMLLTTVISQFIAPILYRQAGDITDPVRVKKTRRSTWLLVLSSLSGTLILFILALIFHTTLFQFLVAAEYRGVSSFLPWIILSAGLFSAGQMASLLMMSGLSPKQLILPKIFTAFLGLGLNFLGAFWLGLPGVVLAGIIYSMVYLSWVSVLNLRFSPR